ncbi:hypothetical protein QN277_029329 [Acacia crassicarpa]|uniref:F-box protein n=1 Tax=Acacia crassicarpa TaxID=499986 RepID=A0AAE1J7L2_9FABA|nr:hypothetical protein QN277_029329 [Acacia crassicarpa]
MADSSEPSSDSTLTLASDQSQPSNSEQLHDAFFFVLPYLPLYELLAMSLVCKSLNDALNDDVLPWLNLLVEGPLSSKLTDQILIRIAAKANGRLSSLALMNCKNITDIGLQKVVEENPFIDKLYIPACTGITPEGVLSAVKILCQGSHNLSILRINGIYNFKKQHMDTLASYLTKDQNQPLKELQKQHPIFYHERFSFSAFKPKESHQIIDLQTCPMCFEVRMVYDCPRGKCKRKECRACTLCIPRCENCGGCIRSLVASGGTDFLCSECWFQFPKCSVCEKPYCKQHNNWWCNETTPGFLLQLYDENFVDYYLYSDIVF